MSRQQFVWTTALLLIGSVTLASLPFTASAADKEKRVEATYEVNSDTNLYIESGVGTIHFHRHDSNEVIVKLRATADDDNFWKNGSLDKVELVAEQRGDKLRLEVPEQDDIELDWDITLPRLATVKAELGVGEIKGELYAADLSMQLGIGEVDLTIFGDVKSVDAEVGIGETRITGLDNSQSERAFISSNSQGQGSGSARVEIETGIGEIRIEIKD
ncbi:hypothetical protein IDSA_02985 [Pseudidiomarina salinarum]|uniref:Adhesin domain-containing protein n=1 Tax=Pseudidiomarina salinarum TaxID=435908 RepID=A0A094J0S8_9GAMM|nr:hypothetical protein [Pseudidiomarina salinarum]KFZ31669.1 hypothetical protein IDSA_02985 [Pseudidiomarina salinarum]RUO70559.1 hypothetical protein CWI79_03590 [Pseudidiomarina salinarum]